MRQKTRYDGNTTRLHIQQTLYTTAAINRACSNTIQSRRGNPKMRTWIHMHKKWLSISITAFITHYYLIVLSCLWKSKAQYDHILGVKDAWREVEEEDQVIYDCYSIPSNQLIVLLPFLCPAVNTHPLVPLSQQLAFYHLFLLLFALNTSFHLFRFLSRPLMHPSLLSAWS